MIEAPSEADVTFSRTSGSHGEALSAGSRHPWRWRLALEHRTQANPTITATTAASFSYSAQPHKLGQYHCWNRELDINTGRWTTPDPLFSSWTNGISYTNEIPTMHLDPTGLCPCTPPYPSATCVIGEKTKTFCRSDCVLQPDYVEGTDFAAGFYGECSCTTTWVCRYDTWDFLQIIYNPQSAPRRWVKDGWFSTTCTECESRSPDYFPPSPLDKTSKAPKPPKGEKDPTKYAPLPPGVAALEEWEKEDREPLPDEVEIPESV